MRQLALTALTTSALISLMPLYPALSQSQSLSLQCGIPVILRDFLFSYSQCSGNSGGGQISMKNTLKKSRPLGIRAQAYWGTGKILYKEDRDGNSYIKFNFSHQGAINIKKDSELFFYGKRYYLKVDFNPTNKKESQVLTLECGKHLLKTNGLIIASTSCKLGQPIFLIQNASSSYKEVAYEGNLNSKISFQNYLGIGGGGRIQLNLSVLSSGKNIPGKKYKVMVYNSK